MWSQVGKVKRGTISREDVYPNDEHNYDLSNALLLPFPLNRIWVLYHNFPVEH